MPITSTFCRKTPTLMALTTLSEKLIGLSIDKTPVWMCSSALKDSLRCTLTALSATTSVSCSSGVSDYELLTPSSTTWSNRKRICCRLSCQPSTALSGCLARGQKFQPEYSPSLTTSHGELISITLSKIQLQTISLRLMRVCWSISMVWHTANMRISSTTTQNTLSSMVLMLLTFRNHDMVASGDLFPHHPRPHGFGYPGSVTSDQRSDKIRIVNLRIK